MEDDIEIEYADLNVAEEIINKSKQIQNKVEELLLNCLEK